MRVLKSMSIAVCVWAVWPYDFEVLVYSEWKGGSLLPHPCNLSSVILIDHNDSIIGMPLAFCGNTLTQS